MFNKKRLEEILPEYKAFLASPIWSDPKDGEIYKWKAVKTFQDNWKVDADDFPEMLSNALADTGNLLASMGNWPKKVIIDLAKKAPEEVRAMFLALYDESRDVVQRILEFKARADVLYKEYGDKDKQNYQYENAISTYLWLEFPDKYYIYKLKEVQAVSKELNANYHFIKGHYADNLRNFYAMYDEICATLSEDFELGDLLKSRLDHNCYKDSYYKTLTIDVGFFISRRLEKKEAPNPTPLPETPSVIPLFEPIKYTKENFLNEVFMSEPQYDMLVEVLKNKKNIILKGAPGVGKTYAARRLAYSIMGEEDDSRIEFVQFHQNYSYEDFIMGYKPSGDGFELKTGIFYQFCLKAANQPQKDFFFIIDEINRGNMSKIFGELLMLIESDYRGKKVTLAYNGLPFSVPENLYIIGMMNTADRSLAMIDYALRRRFSFFDMEPGFDSEGFINYQNNLNNETFDQLIMIIKELNAAIASDPSLGKGYCIGHSYFSNWTECTDEKMRAVVDYDIVPMLEEYWFDSDKDLQKWSNRLHEVFQ